ncbi:MAG: hypothetical protein KAT65_14785, partial [Methanophagales archaeon]|nr:hypothetical protein [Methanophagales archaeon]
RGDRIRGGGVKMYSACMSNVMEESGEDRMVVCVDKPEDALRRGVEMIEGGMIGEYGPAARGFVEPYNRDDIVDEFEGILEGIHV